jgi:type IV pilus assembly protein PilV
MKRASRNNIKNRLDMDRSGRQQSGIGLIEVLIAVLVLAVGILGLASIQLNAKRAGFEASQRSLAVTYARDILERLRSNPSEAVTYANELTDFDVEIGKTLGTDCSTAVCGTAALAAYDVWDWVNIVKGNQILLSDGVTAAGGLLNAFVCINATRNVANTGDTVEVVISWKGVNELDPTIINTVNSCGQGETIYEYTRQDTTVVVDGARRQLNMTTFISDV